MEKKSYTKPIIVALIIILATAGIVYGVFSKGKTKPNAENSKTNTEETANNTEKKLKDGDYEGSAQGYGGELTVKVTIKDGKISAIKVVSHNETPEYFKAASAILDNMVKSNSFDVDAVSGATVTSNALKSAVSKALVKAGADEDAVADQLKNSSSKISKASSNNGILNRSGRVSTNHGSASTNVAARIPRGSYLRDGVFNGSARGFNGKISVAVTIRNGKIYGVKILNHNEDEPYFTRAKRVINKVINRTNGNVDTVSGATYSSRGILSAINNAISKAITKGDNDIAGNNRPNIPDNNSGSSNNNSENPVPPIEKSEMEKINERAENIIKSFTLDRKFKDGKFLGQSSGYQESLLIKSEVTFADNQIKNITFPSYGDDLGYKEKADGILDLIKGENGMRTLAVMKLFEKYLNEISDSDNMYETASSLVGKHYAEDVKGLKKSHGTTAVVDVVSKVLKEYMSSELGEKPLFDSISGATVSAHGMAKSIYNAAELSNKDFKTGNSISSIKIIAPVEKNSVTGNPELKANKDLPLDLSALKVSLVNKDGTSKELSYSDFASNGIKLFDKETGKEIVNGMPIQDLVGKGGIRVIVKHIPSDRFTELSILIGSYTNNFITGIEYSTDNGVTWTAVDSSHLAMGNYVDKKNISDDQTIEVPLSDYGKEIKIRLVSQDGTKYNYTQKGDIQKIDYGKIISYFRSESDYDSNKNLSYVVHIKFKGEIIKGKTVEETNLVRVNTTERYMNNQTATPITIEKVDSEVKILGVKDLPPGLSFDGEKIVGTPKVPDSEFDPDFDPSESEEDEYNEARYESTITVQKGYQIYHLKFIIFVAQEK